MMPIFDDFFWTKEDPRSFGRSREEARGSHKPGPRGQGGGRTPRACGGPVPRIDLIPPP